MVKLEEEKSVDMIQPKATDFSATIQNIAIAYYKAITLFSLLATERSLGAAGSG